MNKAIRAKWSYTEDHLVQSRYSCLHCRTEVKNKWSEENYKTFHSVDFKIIGGPCLSCDAYASFMKPTRIDKMIVRLGKGEIEKLEEIKRMTDMIKPHKWQIHGDELTFSFKCTRCQKNNTRVWPNPDLSYTAFALACFDCTKALKVINIAYKEDNKKIMKCPECESKNIFKDYIGPMYNCEDCTERWKDPDYRSKESKTYCPHCGYDKIIPYPKQKGLWNCEQCGLTILPPEKKFPAHLQTAKPPVALKYDKGIDKLPWDLLPFSAVEGMLRVLSYGQRKYSVCGDCKTKIYPNPKLDGDAPRGDCPQCKSENIIEGAHNWRRGFKFTRLIAAAFRHLTSIAKGQDTDDGPEGSGLLHVDHLMCMVAFLSEHISKGYGKDDRYKE